MLTRRRLLAGLGASGLSASALTSWLAACGGSHPGHAGAAAPTSSLVTNWSTDPYARGAQSFLTVGATTQDRQNLANPVNQRLFFAGEATSLSYPGTAHGAYLSGQQAGRDALAAAKAVGTAGASATICVIGAGLAGLAAARAIADAGGAVIVLEGRDRVGGRVWTDRSLGVPVDLGATWVRGTDGNPLTDLANKAAAPLITVTADQITRRGPTGAPISDGEQQSMLQLLTEVMDTASTSQQPGAADSALGPAITSAASAQTLSPTQARDLAYAVTSEIELEYGADVDLLSLASWSEGDHFSGNDALVTGGFDRLLEPLSKGIDVRLSSVVRKVSTTSSGVTIATDSASLDCSQVIVTLPIGVLKSGDVVFEPPLPNEKVTSITRIGSAAIDKVALQFARRFWDSTALIGFVRDDSQRFTTWINNAVLDKASPVIVGLNAGHAANELAGESRQMVLAEAVATLGRLYP